MSSSPKLQGLRVEFLNKRHVSLSKDILAVVDPSNPKHVKIFDIKSGNAMTNSIDHSTEILEMDLNQNSMSNERKMIFVDSNKDIFITMINNPGDTPQKFCNMVDSFSWNDANDMIAVLSDGKLKTWFYPNCMYCDKELMNKAMSIAEANDIGKMAMIT